MVSTSDNSWVKLYRKSLHSQVWRNPHLWQLWCYCLIRANHEDSWVPVVTGRGETQVHVKSGQFIFGRFSAAKDLKAKPDATYKRLQKLKSAGNLTTQNKTHYTIVSITNWDFYQNRDAAETAKVTPKYHPSNTDKKSKNIIYTPTSDQYRLSELLFSLIKDRKPDYSRTPDLQKWAKQIDYLIRRDKRTPEQVEAVIRWAQADSGNGKANWRGWQAVILSTANLRKHIDQLEMQMETDREKTIRLEPLAVGEDGLTPLERSRRERGLCAAGR